MRRDPVRQGLRPRRLGERVVRRPEHRDEHLRLAQLPGVAVDHRDGAPGVVDEQLLACAVLLAHHHVELRGPRPVLVAEPAVLQPLGVDASLVLLPHQRQRHVRLTQLAVHLAPLRQRALCRAQHRCREQPPLQRRIIERLWQRPAHTLLLGAADVLAHRRRRHLQASRYRPGAQTRRVVQPQNLSYLAHGQPLVRHREPLPRKSGESHGDRLSRVAQLRGSKPRAPFRCAPKSDHVPTGMGDHFAPKSVITFHRND